jgi:hypothetical protein
MEVPMTTTADTLSPPSAPLRAAQFHGLSSSTTGTQATVARDDAPDLAPHAEVANPPGWGALLVGDGADVAASASGAELLRFAAGLGLATVYGLALGARTGGAALLSHALGAPAALCVVGGVGVPAFAIVLALMNAPVDGRRLVAVTARAVGATGLVLAGLAPAALLFALTSGTHDAAAGSAILGLWLAGLLGLTRLLGGLRAALSGADSATRLLALFASVGFGLFAIALAARVWSASLPALAFGGGAS